MKPRLAIALLIGMIEIAVVVPPLEAQRGVGARAAPAVRIVRGVRLPPGPRTGFGYVGRGRQFYPVLGWGWGGAYLPPPYYYDSEYEPSGAEPAPPEAIVYPAPTAPPTPLPESLLLELRGDQWVRVTTYSQLPTPAQPSPPNLGQAPSAQVAVASRHEAVEPAREVSPAVLVFRDGHEEQIRHYTIIGTTLYTQPDYWTGGVWAKSIALADLDVPATLRLNQERGVKFSLPSGPGEVVIRP